MLSNLARTLGLKPVAEGVETEEQRRFLLDKGCALGQGFLSSPAVPAHEIEMIYLLGEAKEREVA